MIFSLQQLFSNDQAITASADSSNVIDLGVAGTPYDAVAPLNQDIGKGNKIPVLVQVTEAFDNLTSLTINISKGAASSLGTTIVSQTILLADLVPGKQIVIEVLPNEVDERYLGIEYVVTGAAPTAGRITAGITMGNQTNITGA